MRFRQSIIPIVTLLVMIMGLFCGARQKPSKWAMRHYDGQGQMSLVI
jgi:hypothetical protein